MSKFDEMVEEVTKQYETIEKEDKIFKLNLVQNIGAFANRVLVSMTRYFGDQSIKIPLILYRDKINIELNEETDIVDFMMEYDDEPSGCGKNLRFVFMTRDKHDKTCVMCFTWTQDYNPESLLPILDTLEGLGWKYFYKHNVLFEEIMNKFIISFALKNEYRTSCFDEVLKRIRKESPNVLFKLCPPIEK